MRTFSVPAFLLFVALCAVGCSRGDSASEESTVGFESIPGLEGQNRPGIDDFALDRSIQECMKRQGFEYLISASVGSVEVVPNSVSEVDGEVGYGFTKRVSDGQVSTENPNDDLFENMTEAEYSAWQEAWRGSGDLPLDESGNIALDEVEPEGCLGAALTEAAERYNRYVVELGPDLAELENRIMADPEMIGYESEWVACMKTAGFDYSASTQPMWEFADAANSFQQRILGRSMSETERTELESLQQREAEVASADRGCAESNRSKVESIRRKYESEFIKEHNLLESD